MYSASSSCIKSDQRCIGRQVIFPESRDLDQDLTYMQWTQVFLVSWMILDRSWVPWQVQWTWWSIHVGWQKLQVVQMMMQVSLTASSEKQLMRWYQNGAGLQWHDLISCQSHCRGRDVNKGRWYCRADRCGKAAQGGCTHTNRGSQPRLQGWL